MIYLILLLVAALGLFAPTFGLVAQVRKYRLSLTRERTENALKHLLRQATDGHTASFASLQGVLRMGDRQLMALTQRLEREGLVRSEGAQFQLTPEGERVALHVLRAHRLWELYLADELGVPIDRVHEQAERAEHGLTKQQLDRLSASMGHPAHDPHGDPIPSGDGAVPESPGTPLGAWPPSTPGRIVHLEDEPPLAFAQLSAEGLRLGQVIRVIDRSPTRVVLSDGENEYRLAPVVAANIHVAAVLAESAPAAWPDGVIPLSGLPTGATAEVVALDPAFRGFARRRLLDLGFTPGARIRSDLATFAGDPRAYRLRGTTIALRREQSDRVLVKRLPDEGLRSAS
ncbi:MAG: iron dependent repressor, metal binding and dimerization domain protein [Acidobacteriota bacterium]|nr:iron dependent repressor, metal binding and dimerization domain protein [Acidobacteriota bacterium]